MIPKMVTDHQHENSRIPIAFYDFTHGDRVVIAKRSLVCCKFAIGGSFTCP